MSPGGPDQGSFVQSSSQHSNFDTHSLSRRSMKTRMSPMESNHAKVLKCINFFFVLIVIQKKSTYKNLIYFITYYTYLILIHSLKLLSTGQSQSLNFCLLYGECPL